MKRNGNAKRRRRLEGWGVGRGYPLPTGGGSEIDGRGRSGTPPQKFFFIFCLAMVHFGASWALVSLPR